MRHMSITKPRMLRGDRFMEASSRGIPPSWTSSPSVPGSLTLSFRYLGVWNIHLLTRHAPITKVHSLLVAKYMHITSIQTYIQLCICISLYTYCAAIHIIKKKLLIKVQLLTTPKQSHTIESFGQIITYKTFFLPTHWLS